jgi:DNA helicase-2/ATP-dependent DNA helicase PcrA
MDYGARRHASASALLNDLLAVGLARALQRPAQAEEAAEVRRMKAALETGALKELSISDLAEEARKVDRVEVTTMTSSKGLEFDVVLIVGMDEKWVPHIASMNDPEKLAEDRRKFYVSVTRARDQVRIFYSGFVTWNRGSASYAGASRFLREAGLV